jgi:hypothetical protein
VTIQHSCIIALGVLFSADARAQMADQYRVKAAFLYNFSKFVEWPPQSFKSLSSPFVIGVLGKNPFGRALTEVIAGRTFSGRPLQMREVTDAQQAADCQIVFVSSSERKRLKALFDALDSCGVLTVGEAENFTTEGGIINFKIEGGSVRLQINLVAARKQQLRISAKLLSLAEIVEK